VKKPRVSEGASSRKLLKRLEEALSQLYAKDDSALPVLVAVSGGKDSHALLHALCQIRDEKRRSLPLSIVCAHFDHALREESHLDCEFVRELASIYRVPFYSERARVSPEGENVEAWARRLRYAFLEEVREKTSSRFIFTAHHEEDQAETLLLRLIDGRLLSDAQAIAEMHTARHLARPFLRIEKALIESYVRSENLAFVHDRTNEDLSRRRNEIRHRLMPYLKSTLDPCASLHISEFGLRCSEDEQVLTALAQATRAELESFPSPEALRSFAPALLWRILRILAVEQVGANGGKLGYNSLRRLSHELARSDGEVRHYDLGFYIRCEVSTGRLRFLPPSSPFSGVSSQPDSDLLRIPGAVWRRYGDGSSAEISARVIDSESLASFEQEGLVEWARKRSTASSPEEAFAYFDFDLLRVDFLSVRERSAGDRMKVWKRGERKLKKLFLEHEIPLNERAQIPLVESGGEILWIPGVARNSLAAVQQDSRALVELRYRREFPS